MNKNNFFLLSKEQQIMVLNQTSPKTGLPPQAIEKDVWVSTILQIVFTLPFADKLIFKGGTSLSKVWGVINRFSEDIDLAVDRSLFDLEEEDCRMCPESFRNFVAARTVKMTEDYPGDAYVKVEKNGKIKLGFYENSKIEIKI